VSDFTVAGIAGSLRRGSYNRALIRAAVEVAPAGVAVEPLEIGALPLFDADVEAAGDPEPVRVLKDAIGAADALLIATPEYNFSIPGPLKNAVDWVSRPPSTSVLRGKPVAIVGASRGRFGTVLAQNALRQSLLFPQARVLPAPQLLIPRAADEFDENLELVDDAQRARLRAVLEALVDWTRRLG
jgi:chromate reductase